MQKWEIRPISKTSLCPFCEASWFSSIRFLSPTSLEIAPIASCKPANKIQAPNFKKWGLLNVYANGYSKQTCNHQEFADRGMCSTAVLRSRCQSSMSQAPWTLPSAVYYSSLRDKSLCFLCNQRFQDPSVIDTQKLGSSRNHVHIEMFSFRALLGHEQIDRVVWIGEPQDYTAHSE